MRLIDFTVADRLYNDQNDVNLAVRGLNSNKHIILYEDGKYFTLTVKKVDKKTFIIEKEEEIPKNILNLHNHLKWVKKWKNGEKQ